MSINQSINEQSCPRKEQQIDQPVFFSLVEKVGSFGKYQKVTIIIWSMLIFLCGEILFGTPFLFYQEDYDCVSLDPSINCKDYVCALSPSMRSQYIPQSSIHSLANSMGDYRCSQEKSTLDNIIAAMFFGIALGYFLLTLFGQLFAKKTLMQINFGCYIVGICSVYLFYDEEIVVGGGLMLAVLGISNCFTICFMFLIETVELKAREKSTVVIQAFYGVGAVFNIFLYWLIKDWMTIFLTCYLIPSIIIFVGMSIFLVDTPMSLIERNSSQYALQKLQFMSKINASSAVLTIEDIEEVRNRYKQNKSKQLQGRKITIIDIFRFKSTRFLTLLLILLQCSISFSFYAPSLMLGSFKFNIYINGLSVSVSQIAANFSAWMIVGRFRRKMISFFCFGSMLGCSIILFFAWDQNNDKNSSTPFYLQIIILVLIFIFQFSITQQYAIFFVYQNQVFPTQARMIAVSMISLMGGLSSTATAKIVGFCLNQNFPVMIVFSALSIICIITMTVLPQTFLKVPKEMIQEVAKNCVQANFQASQREELLSKTL